MTSATYTEEKLLTHDDWFNGFISHLRNHQLTYKNKTIPKELASFYNTLIVGNTNEILQQSRKLSQSHFVPTIISKYLELIEGNTPIQLAFAFNDNEILVWAELRDDDWATESKCILAAAQINSEYHKYGYDITTTFVEESDLLPIPNHYQPVVLK